MNFFCDIKLLPDAEMKASVLMNTICSKLHKRLSDMKSSGIGVSFPKFGVTLGDVLRLHSNEDELHRLLSVDWLGGMKGYCILSNIMSVPNDAKHIIVQRIQPNMSQSKLKRRIKRGTLTQAESVDYEKTMRSKHLSNNPPYLDLASASNGQRYRRYITLGKLQDIPVAGKFDQFGLSKTATVPWFE